MLQFPHFGEMFSMFLGPAPEAAGETRHAPVMQVMFPDSKAWTFCLKIYGSNHEVQFG